jgi:hypothetical protein
MTTPKRKIIRRSPSSRTPSKPHTPNRANPRQTRYTAADLANVAFEEPRWAVPGLIPEGLTLMAGPPKIGKSWLLLNMAVAVAKGGHFLGTDVEPQDCLYMALEDTPRRLQSRLRHMGVADDAPASLTLATKWPALGAGGAEQLTDHLEEHPLTGLVIVDVLARLRGAEKSQNRYDADYAVMEELKNIADRFSVAIIVNHHDRKAEATDWVHSVSGTNGLVGAADTIVALRRPRSAADGVLLLTGRDVEEREVPLGFDKSTGTWSALDGPAEDYTVSDTRRVILRWLRAQDEPRRPVEVALGCALDRVVVRQQLLQMKKAGQVIVDANGYYMLPA